VDQADRQWRRFELAQHALQSAVTLRSVDLVAQHARHTGAGDRGVDRRLGSSHHQPRMQRNDDLASRAPETPCLGRAQRLRGDAAVTAELFRRLRLAMLAEVRCLPNSLPPFPKIVQHVALNTWTNYINEVARTEIDFPVVALRQAA
jgi:hypothetical protein